MNGLQKPFSRNLPSHSRLPRAGQSFTANGSELKSETDVIAEATDRIGFRSSGMLAVDELRYRWEIPNGGVFPCDRVLPSVRDVGNQLRIDAHGDLIGLGLAPMNDQRIGTFISRNVQLAGFYAGNVDSRPEQFAGKQR